MRSYIGRGASRFATRDRLGLSLVPDLTCIDFILRYSIGLASTKTAAPFALRTSGRLYSSRLGHNTTKYATCGTLPVARPAARKHNVIATRCRESTVCAALFPSTRTATSPSAMGPRAPRQALRTSLTSFRAVAGYSHHALWDHVQSNAAARRSQCADPDSLSGTPSEEGISRLVAFSR